MADRRKYGNSWKKIRDRYMKNHPNCELCIMRKMKATKATEVHHIVPICEGGQNIDANLMALCHDCHAWIHMQMQKEGKRK